MWESWISAKFSDSSALTTLLVKKFMPWAPPTSRPQARAAIPHAAAQPLGVRLDTVGEHLEAPHAAEFGGRLTAYEVEQSSHAVVTEVFDVGGVGIQRLLDAVVVHRRTDTDTRIEAPAGQDVDRCQVLGQSQRILPAEGNHGSAQINAARALRGRRQDGDRRGDAVLKMTVPYPGAVETELLTQFDDLKCRVVTETRSGLIEQANGQKAQLPQRFRAQRHRAPLRDPTVGGEQSHEAVSCRSSI